MKSRKRFESKYVNSIAVDIHFSSIEAGTNAGNADDGFTKAITQSMSEKNLHIETINNALDKLLDGILTPEEYIAVVDSENEKLSHS